MMPNCVHFDIYFRRRSIRYNKAYSAGRLDPVECALSFLRR